MGFEQTDDNKPSGKSPMSDERIKILAQNSKLATQTTNLEPQTSTDSEIFIVQRSKPA